MLMDGALARIARAQVHLERGEIAEKGRAVGLAIQIIDGLRASLDMERGGEIAANLDRLYDYMLRRLLEANLANSAEMLAEVTGLLQQIRSGWVGIRPQVDTGRVDPENRLSVLNGTSE
jgi:flagellar protein FliS